VAAAPNGPSHQAENCEDYPDHDEDDANGPQDAEAGNEKGDDEQDDSQNDHLTAPDVDRGVFDQRQKAPGDSCKAPVGNKIAETRGYNSSGVSRHG